MRVFSSHARGIGGARERRDVRREVAHRVVARRPRRATRRDRTGSTSTGVAPSDRASAALAGERTTRGHLVAGGDQRAHRPPAEHSGRSGNEDTHRNLLRSDPPAGSPVTLIRIIDIRDSARRIEAAGNPARHGGPTGHNGRDDRAGADSRHPPYFAVIFTSPPRRAARRRLRRDRRAHVRARAGAARLPRLRDGRRRRPRHHGLVLGDRSRDRGVEGRSPNIAPRSAKAARAGSTRTRCASPASSARTASRDRHRER